MKPMDRAKKTIGISQETIEAVLECEKKSKGDFGTMKCVLKPKQGKPFFTSVYEEGYTHTHTNPRKLLLLDILLLCALLVAGALGVFFALFEPSVAKYVDLEINSDKVVHDNGKESLFTFAYKNSSEVELQNAQLAVALPPGFVITDTLPRNTWNPQRSAFTLPTLEPDAEGKVQISAVVLMNQTQTEHLTAQLEYNQPEREERERKLARLLITSRGSIFNASLDAPPAALRGTRVQATTTLEHALPFELSQVGVVAAGSPAATRPAATQGVITVPVWEPHSPFELVTTYDTDTSENELSLTPIMFIEKNGKKILLPLEQPLHLQVIDPGISLAFDTQNNAALGPNDPLSMAVTITNNGPWTVDTAQVQISSSAPLQLLEGALVKNGQALVWEANGPLTPGQSQSAQARVRFGNAAGRVELAATLSYILRYENKRLEGTLALAPSTLDLVQPPTLEAQARYFSIFGDQLGRGPLPPAVGQETKYWIHWRVKGMSQENSGLVLRSTLPSYAQFTGKGSVTLGNMPEYLKEGHAVRWQLSQLSPQQDVDIYFEVAVTPPESSLGGVLRLLGETTLTATVGQRNTPVRQSAPALTTQLPFDERGRSFGERVVE